MKDLAQLSLSALIMALLIAPYMVPDPVVIPLEPRYSAQESFAVINGGFVEAGFYEQLRAGPYQISYWRKTN